MSAEPISAESRSRSPAGVLDDGTAYYPPPLAGIPLCERARG